MRLQGKNAVAELYALLFGRNLSQAIFRGVSGDCLLAWGDEAKVAQGDADNRLLQKYYRPPNKGFKLLCSRIHLIVQGNYGGFQAWLIENKVNKLKAGSCTMSETLAG